MSHAEDLSSGEPLDRDSSLIVEGYYNIRTSRSYELLFIWNFKG